MTNEGIGFESFTQQVENRLTKAEQNQNNMMQIVRINALAKIQARLEEHRCDARDKVLYDLLVDAFELGAPLQAVTAIVTEENLFDGNFGNVCRHAKFIGLTLRVRKLMAKSRKQRNKAHAALARAIYDVLDIIENGNNSPEEKLQMIKARFEVDLV